jgi:tetratricopeptide (TPR) repeat protein
MKRTWLQLLLLLVLSATLATSLEAWFRTWTGNRTGTGNVLEVALGDGRKVFARHFFTKADAYFHNGYYPTIFDSREGFEESHIAAESGLVAEGHKEEGDFLGKPRDWIESFGRHFFPSVHTHLGEGPCDHEGTCEHGHEAHEEAESPGGGSGLEREILPWLQLSVSMDPERPETYVVGSYWLSQVLKKPDEAEQFLREGLRANPGNPEILFELGRLYAEARNAGERARNLYEIALRNLTRREASSNGEPNLFLRAQLLGNLGKMEEALGRLPQAIGYYQRLMEFSPRRKELGEWVVGLEARIAAGEGVSGTSER